MSEQKELKLTTTGKGLNELLRYIWKDYTIDLSKGPEVLFETFLRRVMPEGMTPERLIQEYGNVPRLLAEFVETQKRNQEILNALWEAYQKGKGNGNDDNNGDRRSIAAPGGTLPN